MRLLWKPQSIAFSTRKKAAGQRFSKTNNGSTPIVYSYMQGGTLIAENDNGAVTDYIYADGRPIAILQPGASPTANQLNYVLADHLGTPQLVSNSSGSPVWNTPYQPFGTTGLVSATITQNLRFPGQNMDVETGFNYNLNRDYMPNLGRYLETDPIGLDGGMNTYQYVGENPFKYVDPNGQQILIDLTDFLAEHAGGPLTGKGLENALSTAFPSLTQCQAQTLSELIIDAALLSVPGTLEYKLFWLIAHLSYNLNPALPPLLPWLINQLPQPTPPSTVIGPTFLPPLPPPIITTLPNPNNP